jgi:hypothetical protein
MKSKIYHFQTLNVIITHKLITSARTNTKRMKGLKLNFVKINDETPLGVYLIRTRQTNVNFSLPLIYIANIFYSSQKPKIMKIILWNKW